jgi:hypothetical protein
MADMISYIHYISAKRRLKEAEKTIHMMGGEIESSQMLCAQRDMIRLEVEYYGEESTKLSLLLVAVAISGIGLYNLLLQLGMI